MLRAFLIALAFVGLAPCLVAADTLQERLQTVAADVAKPSRSTVEGVLAALAEDPPAGVPQFLEAWRSREVHVREADGQFVIIREGEDDSLTLIELDTGTETALEDDEGYDQVRPNGGVRRVIASAQVQFQLSDPDPEARLSGLEAISRSPDPSHLEPLRASIETETDPAIAARKSELERQLTARFGEAPEARIAAIQSMNGDLSVETRGILSQILSTGDPVIAEEAPGDANIAFVWTPGDDIPLEDAYALLAEEGLAPALVSLEDVKSALIERIEDGQVAGVAVHTLDSTEARLAAYQTLVEAGEVPPIISEDEQAATLARYAVYIPYDEQDPAITDAASGVLNGISGAVAFSQFVDLAIDGLSLVSIYFLAAIGLAITFGVMRVINMAHGEFIMMGAYSGYVIQTIVPNYTLSIILALPFAFAVTFAAGVVLERTVIRFLYKRPLETLLATFGVSIALQQLAKIIFGAQPVPFTAPDWLAGSIQINEIIQFTTIRIAIFILAILFLVFLIYVLNRTRLGLEVRAVTQNPGMAASMGINPDRINMLTFGLGCGLAGIAGVALGLYAQVTFSMGTNYIVQSFMTVVVGGVGNVWGTLAGASLVGLAQKGLEWLNPSNTLAAQSIVVLLVILFIQVRPKGIIAARGRAAGD